MNRLDLRALFYREADDRAAPHQFAEDDVNDWLEEAQQEACIRARLLFEREDSALCSIAITSAGMAYALDPSVIEIIHAHLVDSGGAVTPLTIIDRDELDRIRPNWRTDTGTPEAIVHDDTTIQVDRTPDANYTVKLDVYRLPAVLTDDDAVPEISPAHHRQLVNWALYRGFGIPDKDYSDPGRSAAAEARFDAHFGPRPDATMRRAENANTPHHVKACY